jgi:hypothetical protein
MDEQRAPATVTIEPEARQLTGENLRDQIAALQAKYALEQEALAKAEAEKSPPRPTPEVLCEAMHIVSAQLGNPHALQPLLRELTRSVGK